MPIKLEVRDVNGNIIKEDYLEVYNGDTLILQTKDYVSDSKIERLITSIKTAFEYRKNNPEQITGIVIPEMMTLKILRVIKEDQ
ncbi:MAG TPA: hypothetical protein PLL26_02445 [Candidatus Dojkabacteria bacterium]|nr:hypothetical protein [Candidatus Dojkabacteria bacterium]